MDKVYILYRKTPYDGWFIKMIGTDADNMKMKLAMAKGLFPDENWDLQEWTLDKADSANWRF